MFINNKRTREMESWRVGRNAKTFPKLSFFMGSDFVGQHNERNEKFDFTEMKMCCRANGECKKAIKQKKSNGNQRSNIILVCEKTIFNFRLIIGFCWFRCFFFWLAPVMHLFIVSARSHSTAVSTFPCYAIDSVALRNLFLHKVQQTEKLLFVAFLLSR